MLAAIVDALIARGMSPYAAVQAASTILGAARS